MAKIKSFRQQLMVSAIIFGVLALLFGMWSQHNTEKKQPAILNLQSGTAFPEPRTIAAFQLTSDTGKAFSNEDLKGHWSLLFFGFTRCAMLCPTTLSTLNQAYQKLAADHVNAMPQIVFISVDPERDTTQTVNKYVHSFNQHFQGATGSKEQIDKLTQNFNILYMKVAQNQQDKNYQIDHSGTVLLINPQGEFAGIFSPPIDAQKISEDYKAVVKSTSRN